MLEKLKKLLEHPFVDTLAKTIKKFKSSKSYYSVSYMILFFTFREAIAWKFGDAIRTFCETQSNKSDYAWVWDTVGFFFDVGGSIELVVLGASVFVILSLVKVSESQNSSEEKLHHISHDKLDEILKLLPTSINKEQFLQEYFGDDWQEVLNNPQTYHNLKTKLLNTSTSIEELLEEKENLLKKIESQRLKGSIQKMVDKAFEELRYEDVRTLLDEFIAHNQSIGNDLVKAHFQKALSYVEEVEYFKAKEEFEKHIPVAIEDAYIQNEYGVLYNTLGNYDKFLKHSEISLKLAIKEFGEHHSEVATRYNNIGEAWRSKGEYDKAIEFYNKALKIKLATLGENHPSTATSYNNIGGAWYSKEEYDKAIEFYKKDLKICLTTLGVNHLSTATSYDNIGSAWNSKGEYEKAIEFYNKALKISLAILGANHPYIATSYNNIGEAWRRKGEYDKAIEFHNKALKIRLVTLGENHPDIAQSYNNIGVAWNSKGGYDKAIEFLNKALKIWIATLGEKHPNVKMVRGNLEMSEAKLRESRDD